MIIRFIDESGTEHITEGRYLEIEDVKEGEIHNKKWIFRDYETLY